MTDTIATVEDVLAGHRDRRGQPCVCPFHDDANPSAKVYADGSFHCFGCHVSHNRVGLVAALHYGDLPRFQAMSMAIAELAQGGRARALPAPIHTPKPVVRPSDLTYRTLTAMTRLATEELARRPELVERIASERGLRDPLALGLGWAADDLGDRVAQAMGFSPHEAETELVTAGIAYAQLARRRPGPTGRPTPPPRSPPPAAARTSTAPAPTPPPTSTRPAPPTPAPP